MFLAAVVTPPVPLWLTLIQYLAVGTATLAAAIITQGFTSRRERKRSDAQRVADRADEELRRSEDRKDEAERRRYEAQERVGHQSRTAANECLAAISDALSEADTLRLPHTATPSERAEQGRVDWVALSTHVRRTGALIDAKRVREEMARGAAAMAVYARPNWHSYAERLAKSMHGLLAAWLREDTEEQTRFMIEIDEGVSKAVKFLKARVTAATATEQPDGD